MRTPDFGELVGDPQEFFAEYVNKRPLMLPGGLAGDPQEILSLAYLDELLYLEAIRPPYVRVFSGGAAVPPERYTRSVKIQGIDVPNVVMPERVHSLFRDGATVTWHSINQHAPHMRALARNLSSRFGTRSDITAFLTPPRQQGFEPHHDPVDVFALQLAGTKRWRVWEPIRERKADIGHYRLEDLGEPRLEVTLCPGDVLYVPFNTPHMAVSEDQISLHLSVMIQPLMWQDLMLRTVERLVRGDEFEPARGEGELQVAGRLERLASCLLDVDVAAELTRQQTLGERAEGSRNGRGFQSQAVGDVSI
ncbi:JmjC domain-containing protein [Streptomyces sp. NPDC058092]|uniref:JmjC domain-containing protein n=1 Tax=Streptomyces sp. NPDC058092 TaxID=3346336 RepID=UPI0036E184E8